MTSPTKSALTQREIEVTAMAWLCITALKDGIPQVDCKRLAQIGNYASPDSARHSWKPIERKLATLASAQDGDGGAVTPVKPTTTGRGRKRKSDTNGGSGGGGAEAEGTPTKKPRAKKVLKKPKKDSSSDELSDLRDSDFDDGEV
ncbi:hypothetical protein M426DRAFT_322667 [Hypoxylon sp. CI-4A]|nr:hypothetical protein M426DRAFT_322667 [Hypoxylon sp. CI-4A]